MAMKLGSTYAADEVQFTDWSDLAADLGLKLPGPERIPQSTRGRASPEQIAELFTAEGWHDPVLDEIVENVRKNVGAIHSQTSD